MNDHDAKRMKDRCDRLLSMIRKEFVDDIIDQSDPGNTGIYPIDRWMVSIERRKSGNRIVFKVDRPLMINVDNAYEQIFGSGIELAKRIFEVKSDENHINLGTIELSSSGAEFIPQKNR
jgi:hypothetical protein